MNDLDLPVMERPAKRFKTAQAMVAMKGWRLLRAHPEDGDFVFALGPHGEVLIFHDADVAVQRFCGDARCLASTAA